jgi:acetylornithine deacetylase/succinyl-diaminopimelate desuccinylase-like protein
VIDAVRGADPGRTAARAESARAHLAALGPEPRPAGGAAEARARGYAAGVLARAGYAVREEPFSYSAAVGRFAGPAVGALSLAALLGATLAGVRDRPGVAGAALMLSLAVMAGLAGWASDKGVRRAPWLRADSVNLVAEPVGYAAASADGHGRPHVWLVAHLDSKSQPVPMVLRALGVALLAGAWVASLALAAVHALGWVDGARAMPFWPVVALAAVLGAVPVMLSVVGSRSPGALDNASGVAAVLLAAEDLAASGAVRDDGTVAARAPVGCY